MKRKTRNIYGKTKNFKLSRYKMQLFLDCPRCFYLDAVYGISRPRSPHFRLNLLVDELLKNEFDATRDFSKIPKIFKNYDFYDLYYPYSHPDLKKWRDSFSGLSCKDKNSGLTLYGIIDDIWVEKESKKLVIVDYKASTKNENEIFYDSYKNQLDIYNYIFKENDFKMSNTALILYLKGNFTSNFNEKINFTTHLKTHKTESKWIKDCLYNIKNTLEGDLPKINESCEYCSYYDLIAESESYKKQLKIDF